MPKEIKPAMPHYHSASASIPYPAPSSTSTVGARNAAIWSAADDEILLQARASGLNWQPISNRHFPNKTSNACRKRHERLIERRHVEDWDAQKLELLAQEYLICRKEMWEALASRVGERWAVVEAKCMEKGIKALQATARSALRRATATSQHQAHHGQAPYQPSAACFSDRGVSDHNSDSGIGLEASDAEWEVGAPHHEPTLWHAKSASWGAYTTAQQHQQHQQKQTQAGRLQKEQYTRSRSLPQPLPQPLPLYQPPPPISTAQPPRKKVGEEGKGEMVDSPLMMHFGATAGAGIATGNMRQTMRSDRNLSPESNEREQVGCSIRSVLSPTENQLG
ncbi:hypothetical protein B0A50_01452 [Salinomyces thailandicus]|uniref:Myb-like domain-containing protein n=1 Tax=Salinomyces thailandicus TaxID=706561 RepID=A0A4U0UCS7_9PEZI|nr:hypothetical protein B0A50_01452 [Salinomyces thailandica]